MPNISWWSTVLVVMNTSFVVRQFIISSGHAFYVHDDKATRREESRDEVQCNCLLQFLSYVPVCSHCLWQVPQCTLEAPFPV